MNAFVKGTNRAVFSQIIDLTRSFYTAIQNRVYDDAADLMIQETRLRLEMTPDVLDDTGKKTV